jgi:hypothetical protein
MKPMTTLAILLGTSLGVAACTDTIEETPSNTPPPGSTIGGEGSTFDHENDGITVWDLIDRLTKEGPASFASQMHSCAKVPIATLGNVLTSLGVNINNATALSAGALFRAGGSAMGAANYPNRVRENSAVTTSGASRMDDIFVAAAAEIITALPTLARCQVAGVGPVLFDAANACHAEGITCLIGVPASQAHVDICNQTVNSASDKETGKRIAVAAMLAAFYTCM